MKYGLQETKEIDDNSSPADSTVIEGKAETAIRNENEPEPAKVIEIIDTTVSSERSEPSDNAPDNETTVNPSEPPNIEIVTSELTEPTAEQITSQGPQGDDKLSGPSLQCDESQSNQAIDVVPHESKDETSIALAHDVTPKEVAALEEAVMEVAISNDDDNNEVEKMDTIAEAILHDVDMYETKVTVDYRLKNAPIVELSRYSWGSNEQKYLRGCLFSPDGTCILTTVNKDGMHVIELPLTLYENESVSADRPLDVLTTAVHVRSDFEFPAPTISKPNTLYFRYLKAEPCTIIAGIRL